jgi:hypothetical protein
MEAIPFKCNRQLLAWHFAQGLSLFPPLLKKSVRGSFQFRKLA